MITSFSLHEINYYSSKVNLQEPQFMEEKKIHKTKTTSSRKNIQNKPIQTKGPVSLLLCARVGRKKKKNSCLLH